MDHALYTLGPTRGEGRVRVDPPYVAVFAKEDGAARSAALHAIIKRVASKKWSGTRSLAPAHRWPHVGDSTSGGMYEHTLPRRCSEQLSDPTDTLVAVGNSADEVTACVFMNMDPDPSLISGALDERWAPECAYVEIVSSCDDAPPGHPRFAMHTAVALARSLGKRMVVLHSMNTALLWYINTFFGRGVYSVLLEGEECFERSRAYALSRSTSTRDVEELGSVLALCALNGLCAVGLVVHGREALAGLDYADLLDAPPTGAARAWPVSAVHPLVVGHTYTTGRALAGEFVKLARRPNKDVRPWWTLGKGRRGYTEWGPGDVAVFANGDQQRAIGIKYGRGVAFRRTFRRHAPFEWSRSSGYSVPTSAGRR